MKTQETTQELVERPLHRLVSLLPPQRDKAYAYKMGFDAGKNGPNATNCSFAIFASKENTREWERGHRNGKQKANSVVERPK